MNKKATLGDMTMVFAFLFLIVISDVGILAGVYLFYGSGYDSKEAEASLLNYKIKNCLLENELNEEFFNMTNFYEKCTLDKKAIQENNIIKICKGNTPCIDSENPLFSSGSNFQSCLFKGAKKNEYYLQCSIKTFQKQSETYQIITGSKQLAKRKQT